MNHHSGVFFYKYGNSGLAFITYNQVEFITYLCFTVFTSELRWTPTPVAWRKYTCTSIQTRAGITWILH